MSQADWLRTATALGLASSTGLNTTLPLFLTGLLGRWGLVSLTAPYSSLSSTPALLILFLLMVAEFLADKLPFFATVVHVIQWPAAIAAGAFLAASQVAVMTTPNGVLTPLGPVLLITWVRVSLALPLIGGVLAALIHGIRLAVRPLVSAATLGLGHGLLSLAEDSYAALLTLTALLVPVVGATLLLALLGSLLLAVVWLLQLPRFGPKTQEFHLLERKNRQPK
jgi:hypothetical protein